jgi:hypothetical protein
LAKAFTCFADTPRGDWSTNQRTPSLHGGVVSEPL